MGAILFFPAKYCIIYVISHKGTDEKFYKTERVTGRHVRPSAQLRLEVTSFFLERVGQFLTYAYSYIAFLRPINEVS